MSLAVVRIAGKQYLVSEGAKISVNSKLGEPGSEVTFPEVLLFSDDGNFSLGTPLVEKAVVVGKVIFSGLGDKLDVFKFKAKSRYRRHTGFRPVKTVLEITAIKHSQSGSAPAKKAESPAKKPKKTAAEKK